MKTAADIIDFWFRQVQPKDWYSADADFDAEIGRRFGQTHEQVARGEAWTWRTSPEGRLAEIIVLDQFPRQLFRGSARAFASDPMALTLAQELVAGGHDAALGQDMRGFAYMPYMHSESLMVHEEAKRLFASLDDPEQLEYEVKHQALIARFGRYPMRNKALGRTSTPEELAYIAENEGKMF